MQSFEQMDMMRSDMGLDGGKTEMRAKVDAMLDGDIGLCCSQRLFQCRPCAAVARR